MMANMTLQGALKQRCTVGCFKNERKKKFFFEGLWATLPKHFIHYKNSMCEIFLKNIDYCKFPKPPEILMFLVNT